MKKKKKKKINSPKLLSSASDKAKLFTENVSRNSNRDDSVSPLLVFPSRTNLKLHNGFVSPKLKISQLTLTNFITNI